MSSVLFLFPLSSLVRNEYFLRLLLQNRHVHPAITILDRKDKMVLIIGHTTHDALQILDDGRQVPIHVIVALALEAGQTSTFQP